MNIITCVNCGNEFKAYCWDEFSLENRLCRWCREVIESYGLMDSDEFAEGGDDEQQFQSAA